MSSLVQIARMLAESKERVLRLLTQRTPELHAVAAALVEHETLNANRIVEICDSVPQGDLGVDVLESEARGTGNTAPA
jgi:ATP-dependent Zn protease